jgi:hypothetical protein
MISAATGKPQLIDDLLGDAHLATEWEGFTPYDKTADPSIRPN